MGRVPYFVLIPVGAISMAVIIGVSIGLSNLAIRDATDSYLGPVVLATLLTVLIMGVATYLSWTAPDPEEEE